MLHLEHASSRRSDYLLVLIMLLDSQSTQRDGLNATKRGICIWASSFAKTLGGLGGALSYPEVTSQVLARDGGLADVAPQLPAELGPRRAAS